MAKPSSSANRLALVLLVTGKIFGILGLILASSPDRRVVSGCLLGLDGVLIALSIAICLRTMKQREVEDASHKAALAQMVREGTLKQFLQEIEAENAASTTAKKTGTEGA